MTDTIKEIRDVMLQGLPITAVTKGQSRLTPHHAVRTTVYYVRDGTEFYAFPHNAASAHPGQRLRSCSVQSALRRGMVWAALDKAEALARGREMADRSNETYVTDSETGATKRVVARVGRHVRRRGAMVIDLPPLYVLAEGE